MHNLPKIKKGTFATQNSKEVKKGCIFFAIKGLNFNGHNFIAEALEKGAILIFHSESIPIKSERLIQIPNLVEELPKILNQIFDIPNNLTAVTGTNGKTSTAFFCAQSFALLGVKSAFIGTIGIFTFQNTNTETISAAELTTPDIISFYRLLHEIKQKGVEDVFFEASSIGLAQNRISGLKIKTAIFTNFTQDHLDYHKTMDAYFKSKMLLFSSLLLKNGMAIVNMEDEKIYEGISQTCKNFYSAGIGRGDLQITNYKADVKSIKFDCNFFKEGVLNLTGTFQLFNIMLCVLLLIKSGFKPESIKNILPQLKAPKGRMEHIKNNIFIDYAHTPDSLLKALETLNSLKGNGKLITLFGCGGERDKTKRHQMAEIASKYSDFVIVTDDNPRGEDPAEIRKDIMQGITNLNFMEIAGREQAIIKAIRIKQENDILLLAGKGHEIYQIIGNDKLYFNEEEIVLENLKLL